MIKDVIIHGTDERFGLAFTKLCWSFLFPSANLICTPYRCTKARISIRMLLCPVGNAITAEASEACCEMAIQGILAFVYSCGASIHASSSPPASREWDRMMLH